MTIMILEIDLDHAKYVEYVKYAKYAKDMPRTCRVIKPSEDHIIIKTFIVYKDS